MRLVGNFLHRFTFALSLVALIVFLSPLSHADERYRLTPKGQKTSKQLKKINMPEYLESLPVAINQIVERCPWRSNKGKGVVRVVHTSVGLANELYLQWVLAATKHQERKILSTVKVVELSKGQGYRFELPSDKLNNNLCILSTKGTQLSSKRLQRITLNLTAFGQYRISIHPILFDATQ